MRKVGIIGGGIAGLTCAYRLSRKGIYPIVFEKEVWLGGRVRFSILVGGPTTHPNSHALVEELGLLEAKIPLFFSDVGIFQSGKPLAKAEDLLAAIPNFPKQEVAYFQNFCQTVSAFTFDPKKFPSTPEEERLANISFAEYTKDCPAWLKPVLGLEYQAIFHDDWSKSSTTFGLGTQAPLIFFPKEEVYCFEENMLIVADVLAKKVGEVGGEVLIGATVKNIQSQHFGFKIYFEKGGEEKTEEVEKLILATPLTVTQKIFPELKLASDVYYEKGKCLFVAGKLKPGYDRKLIFGTYGDPSNIRTIWSTVAEEHRVYPFDINQKVHLEAIYEKYEVLDDKLLEQAGCISPPGARVPGIRTDREGVYLCGDFYSYGGHTENAVAAGEVAAEMITNKI